MALIVWVVELTCYLYAGQKSLVLSVSMKTDLVVVWVVQIDLISAWWGAFDLISV